MSDIPLLLVVFWAAVNPAASLASLSDGFSRHAPRRRAGVVAASFVIASTLLIAAALAHDQFLDLIDVSPPSFDVAAGLIMLAGALRPLLSGRALNESAASSAGTGWRSAAIPLAVPLLATPAALAATVSYAERAGVAETAVTSVIFVGAASLWMAYRESVNAVIGSAAPATAARVTAAVLVVVGVGLAVDGVLSI